MRWGEGERQKETESGARNQKCESGLPLGNKKTSYLGNPPGL